MKQPLYVIFGDCDGVYGREDVLKITNKTLKNADIFKLMANKLSQGFDETRVYVHINKPFTKMGWHFVAEFYDSVAAVVSFSGIGKYNDMEKVKSIPVFLNSVSKKACEIERCLKMAGNKNVVYFDDFAEIEEAITKIDTWSRLEVNILTPGVYNIESARIDSFYLIEGTEKSLLIDTGMGSVPIKPLVSALTNKEIVVGATHYHGDHTMHCNEFETVCMHKNDIPFMLTGKNEGKFEGVAFKEVDDKDVIDIGDNKIEVMTLFGHTPGSIVFIDHKHKMVFTGDAFGSGIGVLMAIPGVMCMSKYKESLINFRQKIEPCKDYAFYGGHRVQEKGKVRGEDYRNYLTVETIDDMITLCEKVLAGEDVKCEIESSRFSEEEVHYYTYKKANMWVFPSQEK